MRPLTSTRALLRLVGLKEPEFTARELSMIFKRHQKTIVNVVLQKKWPYRLEPYRGGKRMLIPPGTVKLLARQFGFPVDC